MRFREKLGGFDVKGLWQSLCIVGLPRFHGVSLNSSFCLSSQTSPTDALCNLRKLNDEYDKVTDPVGSHTLMIIRNINSSNHSINKNPTHKLQTH